MAGDDNLRRMKTLDDAWNAQDWEVVRKRHSSDTALAQAAPLFYDQVGFLRRIGVL